MVQPGTVIPPSITFSSSSDDETFDSSHEKSQPLKKKRGRPPGSKNKKNLPPMINQANEQSQKPILIEVPNNSDVIEAVIQFARRHQVSISVLSASGSISSATIHHTLSHTPDFTVHGPFTLISLAGTYLNNNPFAASSSSSSSSNLNLCCSFTISFSSNSGQSIIGVVGGKVMAANDVIVVVNTFKKFDIPKVGINGGGEKKDNNNPNACDPGGNKTYLGSINVVNPYFKT